MSLTSKINYLTFIQKDFLDLEISTKKKMYINRAFYYTFQIVPILCGIISTFLYDNETVVRIIGVTVATVGSLELKFKFSKRDKNYSLILQGIPERKVIIENNLLELKRQQNYIERSVADGHQIDEDFVSTHNDIEFVDDFFKELRKMKVSVFTGNALEKMRSRSNICE